MTPETRIDATVTLPRFAVSAGPGRAIAAAFALLAAGAIGTASWLTIEIAHAVTPGRQECASQDAENGCRVKSAVDGNDDPRGPRPP